MTQEQISGNKAIAVFMDADLKIKPYVTTYRYRVSRTLPDLSLDELQYHSDWKWQIPVWSKLSHLTQTLAQKSDFNYNKHIATCDKYESAIFTNDVQKGFEIICNLLQWYNEQ